MVISKKFSKLIIEPPIAEFVVFNPLLARRKDMKLAHTKKTSTESHRRGNVLLV